MPRWISIGVNHLGWSTGDQSDGGVFRCRVCGHKAPVHFYDLKYPYWCSVCGLRYLGKGTEVQVEEASIERARYRHRRAARNIIKKYQKSVVYGSPRYTPNIPGRIKYKAAATDLPYQRPEPERTEWLTPEDEVGARWEAIELPED